METELLPVEEMPLQSLRLSLRSLAVIASPWSAKALRLQRPATPSLPYPTNAICRASLLFQRMSGPRTIRSLAGPAILDHSVWRGVALLRSDMAYSSNIFQRSHRRSDNRHSLRHQRLMSHKAASSQGPSMCRRIHD